MLNKNKKIKLVIFIAVLAVLAAGYFFWNKLKHNQTSAMQPRVMDVTVITVKKEKVELFLDLPGRVSAYKISEVRPQIDGVIKKRKFVEGSFVKEKQQLYQIDPTIYLTALSNSQANYNSLRAKKERYKILLEEDAVSKQEFDDILAAFAQAQADLRNAQTNIDYTKVLAPISGYIGKSNITEGTLVTANQSTVLTTITQLDPVYVDMAQPSKDVISLGDQKEIPVSLITDDANYKNIGTLKFSEMFADESTDSVRLRAIFKNKDQKLIPGMFVNAKLHLSPFDAVTVPQRATNRAPDASLTVWVVDANNVVKPRNIKAEQIVGDSWVVIEGLEDGEIVVYEGFLKIADGMKVNPVQKIVEEKK